MTTPILLDELASGLSLPKPIMDKAPIIGPVMQCYTASTNAIAVTKSNDPVVWATEVPALVANITGNHSMAVLIRVAAVATSWGVVFCGGGSKSLLAATALTNNLVEKHYGINN